MFMYKPTISIYGKRNAGKSSLLNAITEQEVSIVSSIEGTTTDPVKKSMELTPVGPVVFIDTAGIDDKGELGNLRIKKSLDTARRTNIAIYVMDILDIDKEYLNNMEILFKKYNIPYILVINKIDMVDENYIDKLKLEYPHGIFVSSTKRINIDKLKQELIKKIEEVEADPPIVGDLVPYNGKVILVVPIDKQAPKGRLILPQVQVIRDCIDNGIKCYVLRDTELKSGLEDLEDVDLVITDSQIFKKVDKIVPKDIKLTSFSILFARHKGDLKKLVDGVKTINTLKNNDNILIAENCTHNTTHEDIGRVKIPTLLQKKTGKKLNFHFKTGYDFSENLEKYSLVIHCGGCMVNRKEIQSRIMLCNEKQVPITNYGVLLAYLNDILDRTLEIFDY
ncbi:iron-only hydrogenase maturation protein HydF [Keratinibaculum paraultunense]|uniref:Iron-only hydrogenase maturation protein HydF n=2 Tax=Keratinibaculum paraultunense TaxID=1278232 RepID=A0A4R3KZN5_9FIRM|nr:[FeFe] hydrogenase H-cluster maturation GTPase HydF [Keratinibaculum paraultunense]TCS91622.1 iron-only hydrogenase maturation protein HydF [Keratinibaculum paraultunense]